MKRYLLLTTVILAAISCNKVDPIGVQKSSFPGTTEEIGKIEVKTIFEQGHLDLDLVLPTGLSSKYSDAFNKIKNLSKPDAKNIHSAYVYEQMPTSENKTAVPAGNISIFINPDVNAIATLLNNSGISSDLSEYKNCALIALSDMGSLFVIDQFLENDVLGTMNGLVKWLNSYVEMRNRLSSEKSEGSQPDAETLFNSFNSGYTFTFNMPKQEVAAVACSDKDYLSGSGTVDVLFRVTPLHAFDDQPGHGDYYIVNSSTAFNSAGMYKGRYVSKHGGVYVRICGSFAREFAIESFISGKDGKQPIGQYVANATPRPATTIGKTSYTSGLSWNIGASLTGGISDGKKEGSISVSGGVSVENSQTREISDVDILLDQATNKANYTYKFNKAPEYQSGSITISDPTDISTHTATFEHSYIIYLPDIKDNSKETHKINVKISRLNYGACRFYTTCADFKNYTWGLDKMNTAIAEKTGGASIPLPNRIPTGKLKITHDDETYGKYIFEVKVVSVDDPAKVYDFTGSSYAKGNSFTTNLPTGKYNVVLKIGDKAASTVEVKNALSVNIARAAETKLNTGADFSK